MLNIYIVEDDASFSQGIYNTVESYLNKKNSTYHMTMVLSDYANWLAGIKNSSHDHINVYILDIELNDKLNGLSLAKKIREHDYLGYIIFLTAHIEMTAITYQHNLKALNFIYKGDLHLDEKIKSCFEQIFKEYNHFKEIKVKKNNMDKEDDYLFIKSKNNYYKIYYNTILYIETNTLNRKLIIHTESNTYEYKDSLSNLLKTLPSSFYQCHRSFIVNMNQIKEIQYTHKQYFAILTKESKCMISPKYLKPLVEALGSV